MHPTLINSENWTYCHFKRGSLFCRISSGGEPLSGGLIQDLFYVGVMDEEGKTFFQKTFTEFEKALNFINTQYADWDFKDATQNEASEGGCSTCIAH
ncbi:MAG: hypothetical protein KBD63_06885 [Bacteriovoracaceae bacterium]|nr:hypothetical protein [Bacteriovoracaceae bacterium]